MAMEIFKLVGSIFIDTDKANQSLQKTDEKASGFAATLGTVGKGALKFASIAGGAMLTVGGAALTMANSTAKTADEIDKASIRMGIGAERYQELAYAAGQCGVEMSTMEQAAKKLEGTDLSFDDAIAQIYALGTEEERSAKAAELFGEKVAYNLAPLLQQSGEEFQGLTDRAHELGIVMSDDAVKNGVQFGDLMSDLKQSAQALGTSLGSALFPILISIIQEILKFMPQIQSFMASLTPMLVEVVQAILPVLFEILQALMPVAMDIITTVLPLAVELIKDLLPIIQAILPLIAPIASLLMTILVPLVEILTNVLPPLIAVITSIINSVIPLLIGAIQFLEVTVGQVMQVILDDMMPWAKSLISIFEGLAEFISGVFSGNWEKAWSGIVKMTKGFVNTIITYISGTINGVIDLINVVIDAAIRLANLIPGVDINTGVAKIPNVNIPLLAKGGTVVDEGQAIVGEQGAELLTLPRGAKVEPLDNTVGIDYDKLTEAFINALRVVAPEMSTNVRIEGDRDGIVRTVVQANRDAFNRNGRGLFA